MKENGFEYVDLGLPSGTMWATCNVGADSPFDYGLLFQFGRVDGYKYGDKNHKFRTNHQNKQDTGLSYTPLTTSGKEYNATDILYPEDDAAHVNMGGAWRMPTKYELNELHYNTTHKVETINGVNGMMFISKINKNHLFIPFCGFYFGDNNDYRSNTKFCSIWSSSVNVFAEYDYCSYVLCNYYNLKMSFIEKMVKRNGCSIRGVFK